jgi:hypothetical protein
MISGPASAYVTIVTGDRGVTISTIRCPRHGVDPDHSDHADHSGSSIIVAVITVTTVTGVNRISPIVRAYLV